MHKKDDLPAMPFYVGDWLKAPDIQCLSYDLKGLWFEILCYMWESKERGVLLYTKEELGRLLRLDDTLLEQKLKQLLSKGIYSVRASDGAIFSRRMIKDQKIREIRIKAGSLGGKSNYSRNFAQAKSEANAENENENKDVIKNKKTTYLDNVFLTTDEHKKLLERLGEQKTKDYIERLDNYIGSKGKKYHSHYKTILCWVDKDKPDLHARPTQAQINNMASMEAFRKAHREQASV